MLAGATTNTTSLGAAQQSLAMMPDIAADRLALPYVTVYPMTTLLRILLVQVLALTIVH